MTPSRRAVLAAAPLLALGACTADPTPGPVDPDVALRAAAQERERLLLQAYDAALPGADEARRALLTELRAQHQAHLERLTGPGGSPPPASLSTPLPTPLTTPLPTPDLPGLERAAAAAHASAVLTASRPLAALLAQLAASEAGHVAVLR